MARIVLAGGSGYIGRHLARLLVSRGDEVTVLTRGREEARGGIGFVHWDGESLGAWADEIDGADAVVHLAGRRVDCRPTRRNVDELIASRVNSVRIVGEAVDLCRRPPLAWVQMSTMAIYGDAGDAILDESVPSSGIGPRQMVTVALAWEVAFAQATRHVERSVLVRAGFALGGEDDPVTARMGLLARLGLAGPIAGGDQWVSWIALPDLLTLLLRCLDDPAMHGLYLATAPQPVTNAQMMSAFRRAAGARIGLPSPSLLTRIGAWIIGSDPALALTGRRGLPRRLLDEGFDFSVTDFDEAARIALRSANGDSTLKDHLPDAIAGTGSESR